MITLGEIERLVAGQHHDPHAVLGAHSGPSGLIIRALRPLATSVTAVLPDESRYPMPHRHQGVFEVTLPPQDGPVRDYRLEVQYVNGPPSLQDDPYRHLPTVGEFDLHLIAEGRHEQLWRALGAQPGTDGTAFTVWAPNARGVRLVGDFNFWDGRAHPMRSLGGAGIWELFVPGVGPGARYKYSICGPDGVWRDKADPMAVSAEPPPATASVVYASSHTWHDADWLAERARRQPVNGPMSVYEVHLGSWRPGLSYRDLAAELAAYVADLGFTHVEFMPVAEHPFGGSWGYQVTSYYAPTSRFGSPDDFRFLVDTLHQAGIGVIIDWVPAHFPRDTWALAEFDGTALYEHADPRLGSHPDWGTLVFNYGRAEVRNFLVANAIYWLEEFHVDGLRVDAVASMLYLDYSRRAGEWMPNEHGGRENLAAISFLQEVNATCYRRIPGIMMIAEESTAWPGVSRPVHLGGLGFGFKWNMGWMNDTLEYIKRDPIHRQYHHSELTFSMVYAYSENYVLPLSHDEVVHGKGSLLRKMPGDEWHQFAGLRALLGYMWAHPGKQLLFMGSEFGQGNEWSEKDGLDWWMLQFDSHAGVQRLVRDLNTAYRDSPALWSQDCTPDGFSWIDANDAHGNVLSFLRFGGQEHGVPVLACVVNFSAMPHDSYQVGLPLAGRWREVLNTDAAAYGGGGRGNLGTVHAIPKPWHGRPASASIVLPPLSVIWLTPELTHPMTPDSPRLLSAASSGSGMTGTLRGARGRSRLTAACRSGPLRVPAFRLLVAGQFTSAIGDYCYAVALPWFVLSNHGSPVSLGVLLACYGVPRAVLTVPGGSLADRFGPRLVMLASDAMRSALTAVFAVLAAAHVSSLAALAPVAAALGACSALFLPASLTLMPSLVGNATLASANALYTGFLQAGSMLGPAAAGVIVATAGTSPAFAVDAGSYLISATCLALISRSAAWRGRPEPGETRPAGQPPGTAAGAGSVWTLLRGEPVLRIILVVSVAANLSLTGTTEVTLPALAHARYGAGSYGAVLACVAVASIAGALGVAWTGDRLARSTLIAAAFQIAAAAIAVAPFLGGLPGLAGGLAVYGLALGFDNAVWATLIQRWAPPELLGRVWGVLMLAHVVSFPLSALLAGVLTRRLGPVPVFPIAGALLALGYLFGLAHRDFRELGQSRGGR